MEILGLICLVIGLIIGLIYGIQLLIMAFREHILWGLGYLFVPFVSLVFVIMYWDTTKGPFLKMLIAIPFYILGIVFTGAAAA